MSVLIYSGAFSQNAANYLVSSENASYPFLNSQDFNKRRKVWRTAGHFLIDSTNNKIVFRETVAVDLTATIVAAKYESDTTFFAAIKTALEAAGASTYTVSRDTTSNKIKIVSNGGGGGGIFQLITTSVNFTCADVIGFDTSANLTGALTYTADVLRIHTSEYITFDFGSPINPTGFIAVADRNTALKLSQNATIKLEGSLTNNFASPEYSYTLTYSDYILAKLNTSGLGEARFWRFYIEDRENIYGYLEFGAIMLGEHSTITRGCPAFPFATQLIDRTETVKSEGGHILVARRSPTQLHRLNWELLDVASMEELESIYDNFGKHTAFFIAIDPNSAFSSNGNTWCRLVRFQDDPTPTLNSPGNWSMDWNILEDL